VGCGENDPWGPRRGGADKGRSVNNSSLSGLPHLKKGPGRKTDVTDAEWIAQLLLVRERMAEAHPRRPDQGMSQWTYHRVTG